MINLSKNKNSSQLINKNNQTGPFQIYFTYIKGRISSDNKKFITGYRVGTPVVVVIHVC